MTVRELIEKLQEFDSNLDVVVYDDTSQFRDVTAVLVGECDIPDSNKKAEFVVIE